MSRTTRKPFSKSKCFDRSCRAHGSCDWCKSNRLYKANALRNPHEEGKNRAKWVNRDVKRHRSNENRDS